VGKPEDFTMKIWSATLATAVLFASNMALAQQQYDSLGSPTPAPNQSTSPNAANPNVPIPGKSGDVSATASKMETTGTGANSGPYANPPSDGGVNGPVNTGTSTPTDLGTTPSGLTPE
jgi:hypothetical protein